MYRTCDFGICNDGSQLVTAQLQELIDRCGREGGGTIIFSPGTYLVGGLELVDDLQIIFQPGALLQGTADLQDYPLYEIMSEYPFEEGEDGVRAILYARNKENITIEGAGTICGGGADFAECGTRRARPRNILFAGCRKITVRGITLKESGFWNQHYLQCTDVVIDSVRVHSLYGINNDGLDIDSCCRVIVRGCRIDSQDDAIVLKCGTMAPCCNVLVTDCITTTHANHFKLGTESHGGFENIHACNLIMLHSERPVSDHVIGGDYRGASGLSIGAVDGAYMRNVVIENVSMDGARVPFCIRHGDTRRIYPGIEPTLPRQCDGITLRNITAKNGSMQGCYIIGLPEMPIRNMLIENCSFSFEGCPDEQRLAIQVPDDRKINTCMDAFGDFPSYGLYARYIDGLELRNVKFRVQSSDPRPALQYQKCSNVVLDNVTDC